MDPEQSLCKYNLGQTHKPLIEVLHDVDAIDGSLARRAGHWQDVVDALDLARAQDEAKAENSTLRARLRKLGPEIAVLDSLTNMIPDQNGLSVLRGGLATLFKMVCLRLEIRAMILRAFEVIPETFVRAVRAHMRFPDDPELLHAVKQLYNVLVERVAALIEILLRSHPQKNKLIRFWKQLPGREAEIVRNCLDEVSRATECVAQCSTAALERTVGEIGVGTNAIVANTSVISANMRAVKSGVDGIQAALANGVTRLEGQEKHLQTVAENINRKLVETTDQILKGIRDDKELGWYQQQYLGLYGPQRHPALPWLQVPNMGTPQLLAAVPFTPTEPGLYEPLTPPATPARLSVEEVLKALAVPDDAAAQSLAWVTRQSCHLKVDPGSWSDRLMATQRFTDWLEAPGWESDLVLIDGHCGNVAVSRVSPVSAICASLAGVIGSTDCDSGQDRPTPIVLHHFCGQHLGFHDPLKGPGGLIRSLSHQLLLQSIGADHGPLGPHPQLDFADDELIGGLNEHDISSLCRFFCELVVRLSSAQPIFCILDGVSEIETVLYGCRDDACTVIDTLLDLVDQSRAGPALRVLLTSSERSTELAKSVIPPDRRVSLLAARSLGKRSFPSLFERDVAELLMLGEAEVLFSGQVGFGSHGQV